MRAAAFRFAQKTALVDGERSWTFAELDDIVDQIAGGLAAALPVGARCALLMTNRAEYVMAQLALERAALVRVPINPRSTAREIEQLIEDCEPGMLICDKHTVFLADAALVGCLQEPKRIVIGDAEWSELKRSQPIQSDRCNGNLDLICSINYTSGSSGDPKGVVLTFRNWRSVYKNMLIDRHIAATDVVAYIGPLTHAAGTYLTPCLLRGAVNVIVPSGRIEGLFAEIERWGVTGFTCVPTVLTRIVNHSDRPAHDLSSLRWIGYGAEPVPQNTLARAIQLFGPILTQNFGLTEAMMTCAILGPDDHILPDGTIRSGCIGRAYTFVDIVLRAPDGSSVAPGEIGEITIRAEHVMREYWRKPAETAAALRDGWLWTGDLARLDADGFFYLCGRSKDMIISGGFNIYPQEVERFISNCPDVEECAVIGIADPDFGEATVAFVAGRSGVSLSEKALYAYCKPELGIKTPRTWRFMEALPKTPNGKIDKAGLRARLKKAPA
ncbi:class I adenylate-forming enzyme family protein [Mesorhizobium sp. A623]